MLPQPGSMFGRYLIHERLGRGGMGVVYAATHQDLARRVAVKLLSPDLADDVAYRSRFLREAKALAQLDTPYITRVYDAGEQDGWLFIAAELVPDGDLKDYLDREGPMPIDHACDVVEQVARGLAIAHSHGILHRDIKPSNVLLRRKPDGQIAAVLCDLGIATTLGSEVTVTNGIVGTLGYMAPERHEGRDASVASDVYALGCLLWALLTGKAPYVGTDMQVALGHVQGDLPRVEGNTPQQVALRRFIATSMAKNPADRYRSAGDAGDALAAVRLAGGDAPTATLLKPPRTIPAPRPVPGVTPPTPYAAPPPPPPYVASPPPPHGASAQLSGASRSGTWWAIAVAAVVVVAVLVSGAVWALGRSSDSRAAAAPPTRTATTTAIATATVQVTTTVTPTTQPIIDPLGVGVDQRNLSCGSGYIVVLTSSTAGSGAETVRSGLDRFPGAPDRHYLDPRSSCDNLSRLTNKVNLPMFPYAGPYDSPVAACDARMAHFDTTTYVIGMGVGDRTATYCACSYDASVLPPLSAARDNPPRGDDVFWTLELQYMLYDAGFNPTREIGGSFNARTVAAVQRLQHARGYADTGSMGQESWSALKARVC